MKRCDECIYSVEWSLERVECRRYPTYTHPDLDDWCGEWQGKEEVQVKGEDENV